MEQASIVFVVAFGFQSVGVMIMWAQIIRNTKQINAMSDYIEMLTVGTARHINRIDKQLKKENQDA
jgi:hypothetical protein